MSDELEKKESQTIEKTVDVSPKPISGDCKAGDEVMKPTSVEGKIPKSGTVKETKKKEVTVEKVNNGDSVEMKKSDEKAATEKVTIEKEQEDMDEETKDETNSDSQKVKMDVNEDIELKATTPDPSPEKSKTEVKENHHQADSKFTKVNDNAKSIESSPPKAVVKEKKKVMKTPEKSSEDSDEEDMETEVLKPGILEQPVIQTGKRERKKVERLSTTYTPTSEKPIDIPEGKGSKLGECPRVDHFLSKTVVEDLKPLHRIIYGRVGKESMVKKNLRLFNGFAFEIDSPEYKKKKAALMKYTLSSLKPMCIALDLEKKGTRENVVDRVLSFLLEPTDSGKKLPEPKKKRKRSSASDSDKPKPKRVKKTKATDDDKKDKSDAEEDASESDDNSDDSHDEEMISEEEPEVKKKSKPKKKSEEEMKSDDEQEVKKKSKPKKKSEPKKKPEPKKAAKKEPKKKKETTSSKKKGSSAPSDDDIKATVKEILEGANLEEVTMKTVCKQVYEKYPSHDLIDRKDFIKSTVRSLIS